MPNEIIEERDLIEFLNILYDSKPNFYRHDPPNPDFALEVDGRIIGVEHTELTRGMDANKVPIKGHYANARKIADKAYDLYARNNSLCLMVHIDFRCDYGLAVDNPTYLIKSDVEELSEFICDFVISKLPEVSIGGHMSNCYFESFDWEMRKRIFPRKIESISIWNTCNFKTPCWAANQSIAVPAIYKSEEFNELLVKKNNKPKNYLFSYDEKWLLMVVDKMNATSYFHFEDQTTPLIETSFDKVFILQRGNNQIVELKKVPTGSDN